MQLQQSIGEQQHRIDLNEQSMTEFIHDIKTPVTALKLLIEKEENHVRKQQLMYEWSRIDYMLDQHLFLVRLNHQAHDMYFEKVTLRELVIDEIRQRCTRISGGCVWSFGKLFQMQLSILSKRISMCFKRLKTIM